MMFKAVALGCYALCGGTILGLLMASGYWAAAGAAFILYLMLLRLIAKGMTQDGY